MTEYNYEQTTELLDAIKPLCNIDSATSTTEKSDFVTLEAEHNVGFEVFENEIIIFYFKDHVHFEDYSSEREEGEPDYVERAKDFLVNLFTKEIRIEEYYKKDELVKDCYYFVTSEGDEYIGGTYWKFLPAVFGKKHLQKKVQIWTYNKECNLFKNE